MIDRLTKTKYNINKKETKTMSIWKWIFGGSDDEATQETKTVETKPTKKVKTKKTTTSKKKGRGRPKKK